MVSAFLTSYFLERQAIHPSRRNRQGLQIPLTEGKSENDGGVKRNFFAVFLHSTQGGADTIHCPCWMDGLLSQQGYLCPLAIQNYAFKLGPGSPTH